MVETCYNYSDLTLGNFFIDWIQSGIYDAFAEGGILGIS